MGTSEKAKDFVYTGPLAFPMSCFLQDMRLSGRIYNAEGNLLRRIDEMSRMMNCPENCLTRELVEQWIYKREYESHKTWANRTIVIRQLARYMNSHGFTAYETPLVIHNKPSDFVPHIYSDAELSMIFRAADHLPSYTNCPNRGAVVSLLVRLLYGCGLRISEALALKMKDVDIDNGVLTVLESKFEKSRYVPMAPELTDRCRNYAKTIRKNSYAEDWFFPAPDGSHYSRKTIEAIFRTLLYEAGIPHTGRGPRLHDLRHTFAVHCLKKWVVAGNDINTMLPVLSAYLGHKNLRGTQQYLRLTADMYPNITESIERQFGTIVPGEVAE